MGLVLRRAERGPVPLRWRVMHCALKIYRSVCCPAGGACVAIARPSVGRRASTRSKKSVISPEKVRRSFFFVFCVLCSFVLSQSLGAPSLQSATKAKSARLTTTTYCTSPTHHHQRPRSNTTRHRPPRTSPELAVRLFSSSDGDGLLLSEVCCATTYALSCFPSPQSA